MPAHLSAFLMLRQPVLCVAGDRDLICNWLGNRRWVDQLQWEGQEGWAKAENKAWSVGGKQAGEVTTYDTLSFVKIFEAVSADVLRLLEVCRRQGRQ